MAKVTALKKRVQLNSSPRTLEEWIDEAGRLQGEKRQAENLYNAARKQVEMNMVIPLENEPSEGEGEEYRAEYGFEEQTIVDPLRVMDLNAELFWRLVKINITDVKDLLTKEEFRQVTDIVRSLSPTLRIKKREVAEEGTISA